MDFVYAIKAQLEIKIKTCETHEPYSEAVARWGSVNKLLWKFSLNS